MDADEPAPDSLKRLAAGDQSAFADLYDRYSRPIYSLVYRMLQNSADTEEVVQDVFVSLWKNASSFDHSRASTFTWLATIARNKSIDRIRRSRRRLPEISPQADLPAADPADPTAEVAPAAIADHERATLIASWIRELPANQREALSLAFFDGLTHPQIAERLRESIGTVKSRIRLGMEKLRAMAQRRDS